MHIGRLLLERGWVDPDALARGLAEQRLAGTRICSLLIGRGQLDPDLAARALAEQHGAAGALQKHLEHRDRSLVGRLSGQLAHACMALPIGRTRTGELVVCVRDPSAEVRRALAQALAEPIVIAVAPARQLEQLVRQTYDATNASRADATDAGSPEAHDEFEVDLSTQPIDLPDALTSGALTLVELDDARVAKDPSQSGQLPARPQRKPG